MRNYRPCQDLDFVGYTWNFKDQDLGMPLVCQFGKYSPSPIRASWSVKDNAARMPLGLTDKGDK